MEINSIERIWRGANLSSLSSDIENEISFESIKSMHFIDKFKVTYRYNLMGLMITAILILFAFTLGGVIIEGMILFAIFSFLTILGYRKIVKLKFLSKDQSTQEYITAFHKWIDSTLDQFQLLYRYLYPVLFLTFASAILRTNLFAQFFNQSLWEMIVTHPTTYLFSGLPVVYLCLLLAVAILISIFSKKLFKLDINSVYGQMKTELDMMMTDINSDS